MAKKIWQKKDIEHSEITNFVEKFTIGNDQIFDMTIAQYDVIGTLAHCQMLHNIQLLTDFEWQNIEIELKKIGESIQNNEFEIDAGIEDIHSQIELILTNKLGETGKKIHSGRSRNDQVLTAIKLYLKDEISLIKNKTVQLFNCLIELSELHKNDLLPGYTHFQMAMPSSFGLWFSAYAESLIDDLELLAAAFQVVNKNPLGSGAGYGSSFNLNREMTTQLMGFKTLNYNVVYAQMTRGKSEKIMATGISSLAATLSKLSYDVCLYMNQNMAFISFPDYLTTGSSIMPHKKNPDIFELIRAKCNVIQALPNELAMLTNNLPSGYHRDMQLTKERLFPAITAIKECLDMLLIALPKIEISKNILDNKLYDFLFSVEHVNDLVHQGMSFREAYQTIGLAIEANQFEPKKDLNHKHVGSIGNLCLDNIRNEMALVSKKFE